MQSCHYIPDADAETAAFERLLDESAEPDLARYLREPSGTDCDILRIVAQATGEVFAITLNITPIQRETIAVGRNARILGDVVGRIEFSGQLSGILAICLNRTQARDLASRIGRCDLEDSQTCDILDGVGEIINQIAGRVQTLLSRFSLTTAFGMPAVFGGEETATAASDMPCLVLIFECSGQRFAIQLYQQNERRS